MNLGTVERVSPQGDTQAVRQVQERVADTTVCCRLHHVREAEQSRPRDDAKRRHGLERVQKGRVLLVLCCLSACLVFRAGHPGPVGDLGVSDPHQVPVDADAAGSTVGVVARKDLGGKPELVHGRVGRAGEPAVLDPTPGGVDPLPDLHLCGAMVDGDATRMALFLVGPHVPVERAELDVRGHRGGQVDAFHDMGPVRSIFRINGPLAVFIGVRLKQRIIFAEGRPVDTPGRRQQAHLQAAAPAVQRPEPQRAVVAAKIALPLIKFVTCGRPVRGVDVERRHVDGGAVEVQIQPAVEVVQPKVADVAPPLGVVGGIGRVPPAQVIVAFQVDDDLAVVNDAPVRTQERQRQQIALAHLDGPCLRQVPPRIQGAVQAGVDGRDAKRRQVRRRRTGVAAGKSQGDGGRQEDEGRVVLEVKVGVVAAPPVPPGGILSDDVVDPNRALRGKL
mmetsp:Transcript_2201/g.4711  ORF Transcript_2201/g.4711 Transcript_2201/m.4711 type:complete len:447 (-) Transcript_2201:618-1958(-)